jgi:hypothetical protein
VKSLHRYETLPHIDGAIIKEEAVQVTASSLPMLKTIIADAGYGSEENYVYTVRDKKEPQFEFLFLMESI